MNSRTKRDDLINAVRRWQINRDRIGQVTTEEKLRSLSYTELLKYYEKRFPTLTKKEREKWAREQIQKRIMEAPITIRGKKYYVDKSISKIILSLNRFGFITAFSCSGLRSEHPYFKENPQYPYVDIDTTNIKNIDLVVNAMRKIGWSADVRFIEPTQYAPARRISGKTIITLYYLPNPKKLPSDREMINAFDKLHKQLTSLNPKQIFK